MDINDSTVTIPWNTLYDHEELAERAETFLAKKYRLEYTYKVSMRAIINSRSDIDVEERTRGFSEKGLLDLIRSTYIHTDREENVASGEVKYTTSLNLPYIRDKVIQDLEWKITSLEATLAAQLITSYLDRDEIKRLGDIITELPTPWYTKLGNWLNL